MADENTEIIWLEEVGFSLGYLDVKVKSIARLEQGVLSPTWSLARSRQSPRRNFPWILWRCPVPSRSTPGTLPCTFHSVLCPILRPKLQFPFCTYYWHLTTKILPSLNKISWTSLGLSHLSFPTEQGFAVTKAFLRGSPFLGKETGMQPQSLRKGKPPKSTARKAVKVLGGLGISLRQKGCPKGENWIWQLRERRQDYFRKSLPKRMGLQDGPPRKGLPFPWKKSQTSY